MSKSFAKVIEKSGTTRLLFFVKSMLLIIYYFMLHRRDIYMSC